MSISNFNRWHWIAIAVVVGLACGMVRQGNEDEHSADDYDYLFTTAAQFEGAVTGLTQGQHMLTDIVVFPYHLHQGNGTGKLLYLVTGQYWDGNSRAQDGALVPNIQSACYIAPSPYTPRVAGSDSPGNVVFPTVLDYLKSLQGSGVTFRYAWWWPLTTSISLWLIGSLVIIGGIWPTAINLMTFGTIRRPIEEKAVGLKNVKGSLTPQSTPSPAVDPALLQQLEQEIEVGMVSEAPPAPVELALPPSPPRVLVAEPCEPAPVQTDDHHKEFATKRDDYYPTERRTHKDEVEKDGAGGA